VLYAPTESLNTASETNEVLYAGWLNVIKKMHNDEGDNKDGDREISRIKEIKKTWQIQHLSFSKSVSPGFWEREKWEKFFTKSDSGEGMIKFLKSPFINGY